MEVRKFKRLLALGTVLLFCVCMCGCKKEKSKKKQEETSKGYEIVFDGNRYDLSCGMDKLIAQFSENDVLVVDGQKMIPYGPKGLYSDSAEESKEIPNLSSKVDEENEYRTNNIMLEFPISSLMEKNVISNLKEYIIFLLYKDNYNITLSTRDMTTLDTDLINEYCKLFNNLPFLINDLVKILINNINNINDSRKNEILELFSKEVNDILE